MAVEVPSGQGVYDGVAEQADVEDEAGEDFERPEVGTFLVHCSYDGVADVGERGDYKQAEQGEGCPGGFGVADAVTCLKLQTVPTEETCCRYHMK